MAAIVGRMGVQPTSGRKEDSIRSWIKNPGPQTRDSFSKFQDTDNSMDNSAHKFGVNDSPEIQITRETGQAGVIGLQTVQTVKGETTLNSGRFVNKQQIDMQTPQNPKKNENEVIPSTAFFGRVQG